MQIKKYWLMISEANRKRIVSFLNTFTVSFLFLLATSIDQSGFPATWSACASVVLAICRTAIREALNALVNSMKK